MLFERLSYTMRLWMNKEVRFQRLLTYLKKSRNTQRSDESFRHNFFRVKCCTISFPSNPHAQAISCLRRFCKLSSCLYKKLNNSFEKQWQRASSWKRLIQIWWSGNLKGECIVPKHFAWRLQTRFNLDQCGKNSLL